MRSILCFARPCHKLRHIRLLSNASEQIISKHRLQIGGIDYQEGDRVIATIRSGRNLRDQLLPPLRDNVATVVGPHSHKIKHSDIIGKPASRLIVDCESSSPKHSNTKFRISQPSLDQFIALAPREVTPIYSSYSATIVSLLDIHVVPPSPRNNPQESKVPRLEILEAGTGNGGLTLHLARAIAAANPLPPYFEKEVEESEYQAAWKKWRATRRAVVHTIEFKGNRSRVAENLIKSFRGALYWPHIDFHRGDVAAWVKSELERRHGPGHQQEPFLDIAILDLPGVDKQIQYVDEALKWGGKLIVWVPQITQVAACQLQIAQLNPRLKLDNVIELGEGISTGRKWDLRVNVVLKADQKREQLDTENPEPEAVPLSENHENPENSDALHVGIDDVASSLETEVTQARAEFPRMVCRPKVGEYTMGGGFVGIWTKVPKE